jgi:hypothetical protein
MQKNEKEDIGVITAPEDSYAVYKNKDENWIAKIIAFKTIIDVQCGETGIVQLVPICQDYETGYLQDEDEPSQIVYIGSLVNCNKFINTNKRKVRK